MAIPAPPLRYLFSLVIDPRVCVFIFVCIITASRIHFSSPLPFFSRALPFHAQFRNLRAAVNRYPSFPPRPTRFNYRTDILNYSTIPAPRVFLSHFIRGYRVVVCSDRR